MKRATVAILAMLLAATLNAQPPSAPKINVNTATPAQLQLLPGVGEAKAAAIITYRVQHSREFVLATDLRWVKGIGDGFTLAKMLPFVSVTGPTTATAKITPCRANENGKQCQARIGDDGTREVIQYANGVLLIESK